MAIKGQNNFSQFTSLREAGASRSVADSGGRLYKGVTIITAGLGNSRDRNYYPAAALESAVDKGMFEGIRAYADHQNSVDEEIQPERSIRDIVGIYTNTKFVREGKSGGRVVGDLRILKAHSWLSTMVDELIEVGHADKVGISINGSGRTMPGKVSLEEAAEPIEVNELKEFIKVRSADVVTEAGAGGGFRQVLESARGAAKGRGSMTKEQIGKALQEAAAAGDLAKVEELTAKLKEACGCKAAADKTADGAAADGGTDAVAESEDADADADKDLDAAVEAAVEGTDIADESAEGDEAEADEDAEVVESKDADEDESAEGDEADADAEGDEDEDDEKTKAAKEAAAKAATKNATDKIKEAAKRKKLANGDSSAGEGKGTALVNGKKKTTKGRPLPLNESDKDREIERLNTKVEKLTVRNDRLAEALRVRTSADRARKLLRESGIPEKLQPELLHRLIGKSEQEMQQEIAFSQKLVESVVGKVKESKGGKTLEDFDGADEFEEVEGAGSRVRESHGGDGDEDNDILSMVTGSGLPIKETK